MNYDEYSGEECYEEECYEEECYEEENEKLTHDDLTHDDLTQDQKKEIDENPSLLPIYRQLIKIPDYDVQEFLDLLEGQDRNEYCEKYWRNYDDVNDLQKMVKNYEKFKNLSDEEQSILLRSKDDGSILQIVNDFIRKSEENRDNWLEILLNVDSLTYDYDYNNYVGLYDDLCWVIDNERRNTRRCEMLLDKKDEDIKKLQTEKSLLLEENEYMKQMILQLTRTDGVQ